MSQHALRVSFFGHDYRRDVQLTRIKLRALQGGMHKGTTTFEWALSGMLFGGDLLSSTSRHGRVSIL